MSSSKTANKSSKKLVQACLPFKLGNTLDADVSSKCRKRKLSGTENDETTVQNPKVELLNGGAKCFIKSDEEDKTVSEEKSGVESNNKDCDEKSSNQVISSSVNNNEKIDQNISGVCTLDIDENDKNSFDVVLISPDLSLSQNNVSSSDDGKLINTPPSIEKHTPKRKLNTLESGKKQESAKKKEEKQKLKEERERAREEKLKEQAEKLRLKQLEKELKKQAEIEAKRLRELEKEREKKAKEEEKKVKELEKERERKQKEEEKKTKELEKEKERKQKEEEKKAKELEKEKQKEEKLLKDEMEKKKNEKVKAAFVGFFKSKTTNISASKKDEEIVPQEKETYFMPFQTKQDMKIAPSCRVYLDSDKKKKLDELINQCEKNNDSLYLNLLKNGKHKPSKSEATWPVQLEDDEDIIIIETSSNYGDVNTIGTRQSINSRKFCWKLLQFNENKRPPYWGTWRKKSLFIKPRRPLAYDKVMFDYEIDSDDEWEEEDPGGESLHGSDDEKESEDDYEVDNDVFVPHGYLSDEEGQDNENDSEEAQKEKLKLLGEAFEAEIMKKTERIKPKLVGCIWIPNNINNSENVSKSVADTLLKYRCIWDDEESIKTTEPIIQDIPKDLTASENKKSSLLSDSIIPNLITFIHGNTNGLKLATKIFFNDFIKNDQNSEDNLITPFMVRKTIKNIATKATHMAPWKVSKEIFEKYGIEYLDNQKSDVTKFTKSSTKKITSFLTSQSSKNKCSSLEKPSTEADEKSFAPKVLFSPKVQVKDIMKEEQKVNIVGGKKRITPILLSPKKHLKTVTEKKPREKSCSP